MIKQSINNIIKIDVDYKDQVLHIYLEYYKEEKCNNETWINCFFSIDDIGIYMDVCGVKSTGFIDFDVDWMAGYIINDGFVDEYNEQYNF